MTDRGDIECWLTDMDGVLVHENHPVPGASELLQQWRDQGKPYLVLTNNSIFTPRDLSARLKASGLNVPEERIWTSALATADFLASQIPGGTAFVIGEAGITTALHEAGFIMTETAPDYVVIGETRNYSFEAITKAIRLIGAGSRFIVTNPDATGPSADGALRRRQAQPDDVPLRDEQDRRALREHRNDRGPDGHRHHRRHRGRTPYDPRTHWHQRPGRDRQVPVPPR
jgi:NagD protein